MADVWIEEVGKMMYSELEPYVSQSGFKNLDGWSRIILTMANPHGELDGYLYKVTLEDYQSSASKTVE